MKQSELEQLKVPGPIPTEVSRPFWDATANGHFQLQHCQDCSGWVFYPRSHCPICWSAQLAWKDASGRGRLKSYSIVHSEGHPGWRSVTPYPVGLVELEEGPTMLTTLVDVDERTLRVDMDLEVRLIRVGDYVLPMFTTP